MGWVRIDDSMPHHPKIMAAGHRGAWLFVAALCHSNHYLTDGLVTERALMLLTDIDDAMAIANQLVACGLFERVDGGFLIHDYHDFQPTANKVKQTRMAAKERMDARRSPNVRANNSRTHGDETAIATANDASPFADCSRELRLPQSQSQSQTQSQTKPKRKTRSSAMNDSDNENFSMFWSTYPVKKGKAAARKAWEKISPDETLTRTIIAAVRHQAKSWDDPRFIPHPTRWLNEARWEDETIIAANTRNNAANPFVELLSKEVDNEPERNDGDFGDFAITISNDESW